MRFMIMTIFFIMAQVGMAKPHCSLRDGARVLCYKKRSLPILNIALIHYGSKMTATELQTISHLLTKRFKLATNSLIQLNIKIQKIIPLKHALPPNYEFNNIKDIERLKRIWYYENINGRVLKEAFKELKKNISRNELGQLDSLLIITEAQFDGLGLANGRVAATEYPLEIAWALPNQGRVEYPTPYRIVDELIHELGHVMFLGHSSPQCFKPEMSYLERQECCKQSANQKDIMSYCRQRKKVDQTFFHRFEKCNLRNIKEKVLPALLRGRSWKVPNRLTCR